MSDKNTLHGSPQNSALYHHLTNDEATGKDGREATWRQARRKSWSGFTGLTNRMLDSEAFLALRYVHSVKVLVWFWQMTEYPKEKRRRGQESPIGNLKKIVNQGRISFEYRVARYRGMRPDQFSHALRELFKYGFIDIAYHGQGVKGDYTKYSLSDRWKTYDTPQWQEVPFPRSNRSGWASDAFKERRRRERNTKKNSYGKSELSTTRKRSYDVTESVHDYGIAELQTAILPDPSTTTSRSLSRSTMPVPSFPVSPVSPVSPKEGKTDCAPLHGNGCRPKPKVLHWKGTAAQRRKLITDLKTLQKGTITPLTEGA